MDGLRGREGVVGGSVTRERWREGDWAGTALGALQGGDAWGKGAGRATGMVREVSICVVKCWDRCNGLEIME